MLCTALVLSALIVGAISENCLTWAVRQWFLNGGKVLIRRSLFADELQRATDPFLYWLANQVPHFLWADRDGKIWQYTIKPEKKEAWRQKSVFGAWLELWFYDGYVVQGDKILGDSI